MNIIPVNPLNGRRVAIIGCGIFGAEAAMKMADMGADVTVFEKDRNILMGASIANQNRVHMGYHYPRSLATAISSKIFSKTFCDKYPSCIVRDFEHYYAIAKRGSAITGKDYIRACDNIGIPLFKQVPDAPKINTGKLAMIAAVPEPLCDMYRLRHVVKNMMFMRNINIEYNNPVEKIIRGKKWAINGQSFDIVINATYGNINRVLAMAGLPMRQYQYELCEVPIITVPWERRAGIGIMDGPFFGVLPFGFSMNDGRSLYMLWDVETSVLERITGLFPMFSHDIDHYHKTRRERFSRYIKKAASFIPSMARAKYVKSMYVTKAVLPKHDTDDARPTQIIDHERGFYSIFSGKICAAIPTAESLAHRIAGGV
jgi:hypothetical protein